MKHRQHRWVAFEDKDWILQQAQDGERFDFAHRLELAERQSRTINSGPYGARCTVALAIRAKFLTRIRSAGH